MHNFSFFFSLSPLTLINYAEHISVCLFVREKESSLSPLGLSVSLIKDRRLMERECVARLACRPRQQHTTPAVWRDGTNRRGDTSGGDKRGLLKEKARLKVEKDAAVETHRSSLLCLSPNRSNSPTKEASG